MWQKLRAPTQFWAVRPGLGSANIISVPLSSAVLLRKRAITATATSGIGTPFADDAIQQKQVVHIQAPVHDCCCNLPTGGDIEEGTEE